MVLNPHFHSAVRLKLQVWINGMGHSPFIAIITHLFLQAVSLSQWDGSILQHAIKSQSHSYAGQLLQVTSIIPFPQKNGLDSRSCNGTFVVHDFVSRTHLITLGIRDTSAFRLHIYHSVLPAMLFFFFLLVPGLLERPLVILKPNWV